MNNIEKVPCTNPRCDNIVNKTPIYNKKEKKCLRCLKHVKSYSFNTYWITSWMRRIDTKEGLKLIETGYFNDLCGDCVELWENFVVAANNYQNTVASARSRDGEFEYDQWTQTIKIWEKDKVWRFDLAEQQNWDNIISQLKNNTTPAFRKSKPLTWKRGETRKTIEIIMTKKNLPCENCKAYLNDEKPKEVYFGYGDVKIERDLFGGFRKKIVGQTWYCPEHTQEIIDNLEKDFETTFENEDKQKILNDFRHWLIMLTKNDKRQINSF